MIRPGFMLLILAAAPAAVLLVALVLRRPRVRGTFDRDVLILAAHQDDCVIAAGECAIEARRSGRDVQIVYLTCGSDSPRSDRARIRREESLRAWAMLGVPADNLHFLDLPQSAVRGPSVLTERQRAAAGERIAAVIQALPAGSAVFVPAEGESHVDHVALREIALDALSGARCSDLLVLEAPEYNGYYSLLHGPARAVLAVVASLPGISRVFSVPASWQRAGFMCGPACHRLAADAARLAMKRDMLRAFRSEDGDRLVSLFGRPDRFRPLARMAPRTRPRFVSPFYVPVGDRRAGPSVVCLWLFLCVVYAWAVIGCVHVVAGRGSRVEASVSVVLGACATVMAIRKRHVLERAAFWGILALALVLRAWTIIPGR